MKNICSNCIFMIFLISFLGCSSLIPQNLSHGINGVSRSEEHFSNWDKILIYFEDEHLIGKNYKEVAFLRIQGSEVNSKKEVIEMFKKEASHFRADAIIEVNVELIEKEKSNTLFNDCEEPYYVDEKYKVYEIIGKAIVFSSKEI